MKTRLLVFVTICLAGIAAWYFLSDRNHSSGAVEKLIPATSVAVLSIDNLETFFSDQSEFDWWDELSQLPVFGRGQEILTMLDSLDIQSDLSSLPVYVSLHITANDELEPLYFVQSRGFSWSEASLRSVLERVFGTEAVSFSPRNYLDRALQDVTTPMGNLSLFIEGNYLAISSNALLIEDVIRASEQGTSLLADIDYTIDNPRSDISLLLDCGMLDELSAVFSNVQTPLTGREGLYIKMDIEPGANGLTFSGSSVIDQSPQRNGEADLNLKNFIPTTASSMTWTGLEQKAGETSISMDLERFWALHQGDLCLVKIDLNNEEADLVAMASLNDEQQANAMLNELATSLMNANDTLFRESFMQTDITFINQKELPQLLYGDDFPGFDQTYYTIFNNVLLFGNSIDALKTVLAEYDAENTWGRSIQRRRYIDNLVQEANRTTIYNFEFLLDAVNADLKSSWKTFFAERSGLVNAMDLFSLQVSNTGNGLLINAALDFNQSVALSSRSEAVAEVSGTTAAPEARTNVFADTTLRTAAFVVRNHNDGSREMIFQDISGQLYLVSDQGVVQWKKQIGQDINGRISQIDYYNNRKLQFLFLTDSAMHLVDRNGDDVEGFPKALDTELPLGDHRVVDYDNTRRYRYASADRRGNVYLYNKEGALLDGWNPKPIGSQLLAVPEHIRIRGRDCFVMVEAEGTVHLTNRRGEYYPGFPYQTNKRLAGDPVIVKGADFARSSIVVASDNGELIGLNFEGSVVSRNQLLRPSARSRFQLVQDRLNTAYAVVRRDASQAVFFDQSGEELFTVPARANDELDFGFYNFRNDSELFVVRNVSRGEVDVFNKNGRSILNEPIASVAGIGIIYYQSRAEYELFVNFANQMAVYSVRK